ncbi:OmpA family protein [Tunturiibacter gelidoferens]|uniref:Outer membrane protein OmpA-like peptidoglycan-associated protein n=3 Tax=Tunturiibacter TaxID=3154218 RepID=A0A7Y9T6G6_9BACT|nr:OmpA family protein [Edaphobacter lichenicola]MBB5341928.1 outer membrane protein OmpA-like peptidoglycan-associated protein [Edaphobacter lichenicola]NYF53309.1 outer membrane protein OmpA-like peptidoglycan-associated protein [Edaphobacter lichenicola]
MNRTKNVFTALMISVGIFGYFGAGSTALHAQEPNPTAQTNPPQNPDEIKKQDNGIYIYRVKVVQRDLDAVNYLHRSGSTNIGFRGTPLLPLAKGEAKVTSERGGIHISARFQGLTPANGFGPEYLTYVLWAITPDGRPNNLGEVLPANNKNNIEVTTALQSFGMIVTAEPYFSVTQPSDVVVLQNVIINDKTTGVLEKVNAHYSLLARGSYAQTEGSRSNLNPITRDERSPLELYQANNAVRIAQAAGADKYAPDIMAEAMQDLRNATDIDQNKKGDRKMEITFARQAVQRSEDARLVTLRKQAAERQLNADNAKRDAEAQAQQSQLQAQQSQLEAERARAAQAEADADRARAEAAAAEAQARAAAANKSATDANAVRERLRSQLNSVLATSESARGLIVNMSDVLFDTGRYTLKTNTQISLAKVAGILQAYPGLKLQVEGYTDSVGGDQYNQKLSENRADAVRDFLVTQGVQTDNISATGYGKAKPVADNATAQGRAQNRRVNLVVSGDAIGVQQSSPDADPAPPTTPQ